MAIQPITTGASPQIMNLVKNSKKVHDAMKNGQKVNNCSYCHSGTGIKQSKQGFKAGQAKFTGIKNIAKCAGAGCHM